MQHSKIEIQYAYTHNLKGISCTLPIYQWIVLTGVSGSGKSSFVLDTLVQESAAQYRLLFPASARSLQTRSRYGHRCLAIRGLPPTLSLTQSFTQTTPRSTVSSLTRLQEGLACLYAQYATPYCPIQQEPLVLHTEESILSALSALPKGHQLIFLRPLAPCASFPSLRTLLLEQGYAKLRVNDQWIDLYDTPHPEWRESDKVELLLDRIKIESHPSTRMSKAIQQALQHDGSCHVVNETSGDSYLWKAGHYSVTTGLVYPPLSEMDFTLMNPQSLCPTCQGLEGNCSTCQGSGMHPYPASARWRGITLPQLLSLPIQQLTSLLHASTSKEEQEILDHIWERLRPLIDLGLEYLTLNRRVDTLSQGEVQRVRLAAEIGGALTGLVYVLDEPMQGLHAADQVRLLPILRRLRDRGNTLLIVDHHSSMIRAADEVIDFGPGAGREGGEILYQGSLEGLLCHPTSLTGAYLSGRTRLSVTASQPLGEAWLEFRNLPYRNLKPGCFRIPLNRITAVTGVSGSGKSTLLFEVLLPAIQNHLGQKKTAKDRCTLLIGAGSFQDCITLEPMLMNTQRRSVVATYLGLYDGIRQLFASLPESQQRGWDASMFSFNRSSLRCPGCQGIGTLPLEDDSRLWILCPDCDGERFTDSVLEIRYKGRSIADLLNCTVTEAHTLLPQVPALERTLQRLIEIGLGYLTLGQPLLSLSGGEAQRLRVAKQLGRAPKGPSLYLLDEPSRGLHPHDLNFLWKLVSALIAQGHTVILIEHQLDLIRACDWVIEMGPKGGAEGGYLLAAGTPNEISGTDTPTGQALSNQHLPVIQSSPPPLIPTWNTIQIEGADAKNLHRISLEIPKQQLTVVSGPMGAGKSALLVDTLHAASLRYYGMQLFPFLLTAAQIPAKALHGITPTTLLGKGSYPTGMTLGNATRLTEMLYLLFHLRGQPRDTTGGPCITRDELLALISQKQGSYVILLAPVPHERSCTLDTSVRRWAREGWVRIRLGASYYDMEDLIPWAHHAGDSLALVIDEMRIGIAAHQRLQESILRAFETGGGRILVSIDGNDQIYNLRTLESLHAMSHQKMDRCLGHLQGTEALGLPVIQLLQHLEQTIPQDCHLLPAMTLLIELGLGHYTLNTPLAQLNQEEQIRCGWIPMLSTPLRGLTYLLDERSLGLVPDEQKKFAHILQRLLTQGHTLLVAANDPFWIQHADHLITLGPDGGPQGGQVIFTGLPRDHQPKKCAPTLTMHAPHPTHALYGDGWTMPIGGGLSILNSPDCPSLESWWPILNAALAPYFPQRLMLSNNTLFSSGTRVADLTGLAPLLRGFYSLLPTAAAEGLSPGHFDAKNPLGQCTTCRGQGECRQTSLFLPMHLIPCSECKGSGLHPIALSIRYRDANLGDVFEKSITEVSDLFSFLPKVHTFCLLLQRWGLGYLPLCRSGSALSSGEQQTLRLFRALRSSASMILMDRPTLGMEENDVIRWIPLFEEAIHRGCSFLIYDYHPIWQRIGCSIHTLPKELPTSIECYPLSS